MKFLKLLVIVILAIFISSCGDEKTSNTKEGASTTPIPEKQTNAAIPKVVASDYDSATCYNSFVTELGGKCKYIKVKAKPDNPNSDRYLDVYYSIVPAINQANKKEPIVFLIGGPGSSTTHYISPYLSPNNAHAKLLETHDYVFVDYRGTGFSQPSPIVCSKENHDFIEGLNECIAKLPKDVVPSDYTSHNIAYDINEVLKKENITKADLFGISYGTRVASTIMRDFPDRVNKAVLDGFFAIEANGLSQAKEAVLDKLDFLRNKYNKAYPNEDFETRLLKYVENKTDKIKTLTEIAVSVYKDNSEKSVKSLFDTNSRAVLARSYTNPKYYYLDDSSIMSFAVILHEELAFVDSQPAYTFGFSNKLVSILDNFGGGAPMPIKDMYRIKMSVKKPSILEKQPLTTDIPILILSAGLDMKTPLYWAKNAQKNFSNVKHFFFKEEDHGLSFENKEAIGIVNDFLNTDNLNSLNAKKSENFELVE